MKSKYEEIFYKNFLSVENIIIIAYILWLVVFPIRGTIYQIILYALPILTLIILGNKKKSEQILTEKHFLILSFSLLAPIIPTLISNFNDLNISEYINITKNVSWRLVVFTFALAIIFADQKDRFINLTFLTIICATTTVGLLGIINFLNQSIFVENMIPERVSSLYKNPGRFGVMMAIGLVSTVMFRSKLDRKFGIACLMILSISLVLSGSRASWVGVLAALAMILMLSLRHISRRNILRGLLTCLLVAISTSPILFMKSQGTQRFSNVQTIEARLGTWNHHWSEVLKKPIFGHGKRIDYYRTSYGQKINHMHNMFLQTLYTFGIFGLLSLFTVLCMTVYTLYKHQETQKLLPIFGLLLVVGLFDLTLYASEVLQSMFAIFFATVLIYSMPPKQHKCETPS